MEPLDHATARNHHKGSHTFKSINPDKAKTTRDKFKVKKSKTHPLLLGDDADDPLLALGTAERGGGTIGGGRVGLGFGGVGAGAGTTSSVFRPRCQNIGMLLFFSLAELEESTVCWTRG